MQPPPGERSNEKARGSGDTEDAFRDLQIPSRLIAFFCWSTAIALLQLAIWTQQAGLRTTAGLVAAALIAFCFFRFAGRAERSIVEPYPGNNSILPISLVMAAAVLGIGYATDIWSPDLAIFSGRTLADWFAVKIPTVVLQQLLFQCVLLPTLLFITRRPRWTILVSAAIFGILHFPNPLLMLLTAGIGVFWFAMSLDRPRFVSITLSHLLLAVVVANVAGEYVLDMRVGQTCLQKWPATLCEQSGNRSITVYPRAVAGSIDSILQVANRIEIRGTTFDEERGKPPQKVFVVLGGFDPQDEEGQSWRPEKILDTDRVEPDGSFQLNFQPDCNSRAEIRLFVQHQFGWCYPVNDSERIEIHQRDPSGETICLFPRETHGNIGHLKKRGQRTDLIGWGFHKKDNSLLDSLLVHHRQELVPLQLQRRNRKEIAKYYATPALEQCGFLSRIPFVISQQRPPVYVRNSRGFLERMPMEFASGNPERMAQKGTGPVR